ncbi:uncharacterized protein [Typha latifolia]|uniref:uncharacterized protein n=1 Tax=Typha latifolia TaxID=4733 RepID=UPI003C2DFBB9
MGPATTGGEDVHQRRASSSKVSEPERAKQAGTGKGEPVEHTRSWASVAAGSKRAPVKPGAIPAEILVKLRNQLKDSVVIEPEVLEKCRERWKLSLFGSFLGKGIPLVRMKTLLGKLWVAIEGFSISDMAEGYYVFRFEKEEDLNHVLTNGPWTIQGQVLNLIPWRNNFRPSPEAFTTAPSWIQLHNLPQEYWELEALIPVAAFFGRPLRVDETTLDHTRSRFARVCIEADLSKPLKTAVWLGPKEERVDHRVMYESIPKFCFKCGTIGHKAEECGFKSKDRPDEPPATKDGQGGGDHQRTNPNTPEEDKEEDNMYYGARKDQVPIAPKKEWAKNQRERKQYSQANTAQGEEKIAGQYGKDHQQASTSRRADGGVVMETDSLRRSHASHPEREHVGKLKKAVEFNLGKDAAKWETSNQKPIRPGGVMITDRAEGPAPKRRSNGEKQKEVRTKERDGDTEGDHLMLDEIGGARKKEALDRCRVMIRDFKLDISGGIMVIWKKEIGWVDVAVVSRYAVHLTITLMSGKTWIWTMVYASTHIESQQELWEELMHMATINTPWAIIGDFNAFLSPQEKRCSGEVIMGPKCKAFAKFVDDTGLCDLGYEGIPYTWCNNQKGDRRMWIRLDRALGNTEWVSEHPASKVQHLDRGASNHAPILLRVPLATAKVRRPFRFELYLMKYEECQSIVKDTWARHADDNPMHALTHHVSELRRSLNRWSREEVGCVERRLKDTNTQLADLEELDANGQLSEEGLKRLRSLYNCKAALNRQLNIKWLQRSRLRWTEEGDRNTKFFHISATMRRQRNMISGIMGDGERWVEEPAEGDGSNEWPTLLNISAEEAIALERPVTPEEIKEAVWSLPRGKAPGLDGMLAEVYTKYWDTIGGSLCQAVGHFFTCAAMSRSWGETFITLIPKKEHPTRVADYRPIALCNVMYKVIAKVIVSRLKTMLPKLIGPEQAAFVADRSIGDNTLAAQEVAHSMAADKGEKPIMMVKMDMEKAYDRVSWRAVIGSLQRMGFPPQWCNWVQACIASPRYALLINGSPTN